MPIFEPNSQLQKDSLNQSKPSKNNTGSINNKKIAKSTLPEKRNKINKHKQENTLLPARFADLKQKQAGLIANTNNNPIWLSVSEAAKLGGVKTKTIRRAIQSTAINYKIAYNRYLIDAASVIIYLLSNTKLKNKLNRFGIGQYVDKWKE